MSDRVCEEHACLSSSKQIPNTETSVQQRQARGVVTLFADALFGVPEGHLRNYILFVPHIY